MKEIMQHIQKNLPDEIDGVLQYSAMSKLAESENEPGLAAILRDMAKEEFCHAKHLKEIIHKTKDMQTPANHADMVKKWKEAEKAIEEI